MKKGLIQKSPYTQLIYRPFWITVSGLLIILTVALAILINSSWRAVHRTEPLKSHMLMIGEIQHYNMALNTIARDLNSSHNKLSLRQAKELYQEMTDMLNTSMMLSDEARPPLLQVAKMLKNIQTADKYDLSLANKNIQIALNAEVNIQNDLLHLLARDNLLELKTTTFIATTLPLLGLLLLFFLRHRILRPLNSLSLLITRLGRQADKETLSIVPLADIDPILRPLFIDFNLLIQRLSELELAQQKNQFDLENKVRNATQSLLEYQHTLAQSERLAAVGELTAGLAHELKNPLAGIHLTLANLREEIKDQDQTSRLTLVIEELERVTKLLNQTLDQSRHTPEPITKFNLSDTLNSLLQLVRYQIPATIKIEQNINGNITCLLPQSRLKQTILNLVLNSAQSIENSHGLIHIETSRSQQEFSIRIFDSGQGFSEKMLKHGVRPFMTGRDNGTGLGLSIARRFCYDLGGELLLTNPTTGGACVEIKLPENTLYE